MSEVSNVDSEKLSNDKAMLASLETCFKNWRDNKHMAVENLKEWSLNVNLKIQRIVTLIINLIPRITNIENQSKTRNEDILKFFDKFIVQLKFEALKPVTLNCFEFQRFIVKNDSKEIQTDISFKEAIIAFQNDLNSLTIRIEDLKNQIKSNIQVKLMGQLIKPSESRLKELLAKLISVKKLILHKIEDQDKKYFSLIKKAEESKIDLNNGKRVSTNMLDLVIGFVQKTERVAIILKEIVSIFTSYLESGEDLERVRLTSLKISILEFIDIITLCFGKSSEENFLLSKTLLLKISENEIATNEFDLKLILTPSEMDIIKRQVNTSEDTNFKQVFKQYLSKSPFDNISSELISSFYLRKFSAMIIKNSSTIYEVNIFVSLDYYISFYKLKGKKDRLELITSFNIEYINQINELDKNQIELKFTEEKLLWKSQSTLRFLLQADLISDFKLYIENIQKEISQWSQFSKNENLNNEYKRLKTQNSQTEEEKLAEKSPIADSKVVTKSGQFSLSKLIVNTPEELKTEEDQE